MKTLTAFWKRIRTNPPTQDQRAAFLAGANAMRDLMLGVSRKHALLRTLADGQGDYYLGAEHAALSLHEDLTSVPIPGEKK